ncbi:MAG TPA: hypothetical protein VEK57_15695 [Thermoanaerobaculia bacterium]|nr:hypothetical protein [Thermoanaerobaculia bacterium]
MSSLPETNAIQVFSPQIYNRLPDVFAADKTLRAAPCREEFFREIGDLICLHDLERYVGVSLLHKHNEVGDDQLMVEVYDEEIYDRPALVMQRTAVNEAPDRVPVVLKVQGDGPALVAIEHSSVGLARDAYLRFGERTTTFVPSFCEVIRKYGYEDLIGLAVIRESVLSPERGEELIEQTDEERVANVVFARPERLQSNGRSIPTTWWFTAADSSDPTRVCVSCTPGKRCPTDDKGNHEKREEPTHKLGHQT